MSDTVVPAPRHSTWRLVAWIALPLLVLAAAIAWIVAIMFFMRCESSCAMRSRVRSACSRARRTWLSSSM